MWLGEYTTVKLCGWVVIFYCAGPSVLGRKKVRRAYALMWTDHGSVREFTSRKPFVETTQFLFHQR